MAAKAYATVKNGRGDPVRVCGIVDHAAGVVMVHVVNGPRLGGFRLSRFGGRLTPKTLAAVLSGGEG